MLSAKRYVYNGLPGGGVGWGGGETQTDDREMGGGGGRGGEQTHQKKPNENAKKQIPLE